MTTHFISLGAGVQSTTMALMAAAGEIELMPSCAWPLARKQRELLGYQSRQRIPEGAATVWIGISLDEAVRMKTSSNKWQVNRWPLIEKDMTRRSCLAWLEQRGWSAPRSACIGCPYHSNAHWRRLRDDSPEEWDQAVAVDRSLRVNGGRGMDHQRFMHRQLVPLDEVDLRTAEDHGQLNMFNNECEGMCGV